MVGVMFGGWFRLGLGVRLVDCVGVGCCVGGWCFGIGWCLFLGCGLF